MIGALALSSTGCRVLVQDPAATVVHVAAPTGVEEQDRHAIQAALDAVLPGGTVQFAAGTYRIGRSVRSETPRATLLGHAGRTVIRGGDPEDFEPGPGGTLVLVVEHTGLELCAEAQTVRGLTFEYAWHGIFIGRTVDTVEELKRGGMGPDPLVGGHCIERNVFRTCSNGIRVYSEGRTVNVIRDNDFVDTFHAIVINAGTVHFLDNRIRVEQSRRVPYAGHPGDPLVILPYRTTMSEGHRIIGNRIVGHPDGIKVFAPPGTTCRAIEIRANVVQVRRVPVPDNGLDWLTDPADRTFVGVPIRVEAAPADAEQGAAAGVVSGLRIEHNRIVGCEGIAILVGSAINSVVRGNEIRSVARREPFPGNTLGSDPRAWHRANGAAIWLSARCRDLLVTGNRFHHLAAEAVVVEGSGNRIEVTGGTETVRDLGSDNRIVNGDR